MNTLYYGDNLEILRRYVKDESVDLVYLDPPFNSAQDYNVLFAERDGDQAAAQIQAFEDTWRWDENAAAQYHAVVEAGGSVSTVLQAFRQFLGTNDMLAYLTMMAPRLVELHRVLKSTGSLYLHCDPTASHYLKLLLDAVFGPEHFRNEIIWKRSHAHNSAKKYGANHDVILYFTKSDDSTWNRTFQAYDPHYVAQHYRHVDAQGRRYKHENPTGAGVTRDGPTGKPWRGIDPSAKGRHWAKNPEEMDRLDAQGRIYWPPKDGAWPYLIQYLDEMPGVPCQDTWFDIDPINMRAQERLGYPTQKPLALLERIITASSKVGDVVLDPFCGCGTTVDSAQRLGRQWIGIDITHLAIGLIRQRMRDAYGAGSHFTIVGEPTTIDDAAQLAADDKFQFQAWALGLVGARPAQVKKGADKGIDGRLYFHGAAGDGKTDQIIISVKGGKLKADDLRALDGVRNRENAAIGVLLSFGEPSKKMRTDAAALGMFDTPWGSYPRIQLLTVGELLEGKQILYPHVTEGNKTHKRAPKAKASPVSAPSLFETAE